MVTPAFVPGPARPLGTTRYTSRYAPVLRPVIVRAAPAAGAAAVTAVATKTPEDTTNIVEVLGRRRDAAGKLWVKASLATLPNGRPGWLPRTALGGYGSVDTHLVIDLERLTATLTKAGRVVFRARVGVGQPGLPTPRGEGAHLARLHPDAQPRHPGAGEADAGRHPTHDPLTARARPES
jgi:hypothetical protein